jgi:phenylalanyl-tRNA synthetase beta chain
MRQIFSWCPEACDNTLEIAKKCNYELDWSSMFLPKFPDLTRDIAVVCDEAVTVGALEKAIHKGGKSLLKGVSLFDIYRGKGIDEGKKSVAFNLILRADDRSLTAEEADADVKSILETLAADCGAILR